MKGKLEILLQEGHLANLPEFEILYKNHLSKAEKFNKSKATAERARKTFDEKMEQGRMDLLFTLEPKTAFLISKYRKKIAKVEFLLAEKRLEIWMNSFLKNPEQAELVKYLDKKLEENRTKADKNGQEKNAKTEKTNKKLDEKKTIKLDAPEEKARKTVVKKAMGTLISKTRTAKKSK